MTVLSGFLPLAGISTKARDPLSVQTQREIRIVDAEVDDIFSDREYPNDGESGNDCENETHVRILKQMRIVNVSKQKKKPFANVSGSVYGSTPVLAVNKNDSALVRLGWSEVLKWGLRGCLAMELAIRDLQGAKLTTAWLDLL